MNPLEGIETPKFSICHQSWTFDVVGLALFVQLRVLFDI